MMGQLVCSHDGPATLRLPAAQPSRPALAVASSSPSRVTAWTRRWTVICRFRRGSASTAEGGHASSRASSSRRSSGSASGSAPSTATGRGSGARKASSSSMGRAVAQLSVAASSRSARFWRSSLGSWCWLVPGKSPGGWSSRRVAGEALSRLLHVCARLAQGQRQVAEVPGEHLGVGELCRRQCLWVRPAGEKLQRLVLGHDLEAQDLGDAPPVGATRGDQPVTPAGAGQLGLGQFGSSTLSNTRSQPAGQERRRIGVVSFSWSAMSGSSPSGPARVQ